MKKGTPAVCAACLSRLVLPGAAALLALAGAATARVLFALTGTDMVQFKVIGEEWPGPIPLFGCILLFELLLFKLKSRTVLEVFAPFLLTLPFLPFELSINLLIAYAVAAGLSVYRGTMLGAFDNETARKYFRKLPCFAFAAGILMIALGVFASKYAYDRMFLTIVDWGLYAQTAWYTAHGRIMQGTWPVPNFSEWHFMPGYFFTMGPVLRLFPSVFTVFVTGAAALWGSAWLLYLFARKRGFHPAYAAAFALIWLLCPSVSNMNLTSFYGINELAFFIPVFFGFYMLYEARRYRLAFLVFLFSLTIKETVGIFWLGWGVVSFFEKRRRDGLLYGVIGATWFLFSIKVVIPFFSAGDYIFYSQFEALGGGIFEILLSPITHPAEFWGQFLRVRNLQLVLLLLLPFFPGALNRPWLLGAGAILIGFNFIRGSETIVNLVHQYQIETISMFAIATVLGVRRVKAEGRLARLLRWGLTGARLRNTRLAMTTGTLGCALFAHIFFAETFYGKNNLQRLTLYSDASEVITEMQSLVPPGEPVNASQTLAPQFLFRNPLHGLDRPEGKFLLYHIGDDSMHIPLQKHRETLQDPQWVLLWDKALEDGRTLFLFRRTASDGTISETVPAAETTPRLPVVENEKASASYFAASCRPDGENTLLTFQLLRPLPAFAQIHFKLLFPDNTAYFRSFFFANAALLPEQTPVGTTYELLLPVSINEFESATPAFELQLLE